MKLNNYLEEKEIKEVIENAKGDEEMIQEILFK